MNKFQQIPSKLSEVYLVGKKRKKERQILYQNLYLSDFTVGETGPFFIRTLKAAAASAAFLQHN